MKLPRILPAIAALAIVMAAAGVAGASTIGNSSPHRQSANFRTSRANAVPTVHTSKVVIGGMTEIILVNAKGLPLYTYEPDTTTKSLVTGELATLWPPLVDAKAPTAKGIVGKLTVVRTQNGPQVAYRGHFLYSFAQDTAGHVTGQGVQNFYVATPKMTALSTATSASSAQGTPLSSSSTVSNPSTSSNNPAPSTSYHSYGY